MAQTNLNGSLNLRTSSTGVIPQYLINDVEISGQVINNRNVINVSSEFPDAVGGVITLEDSKEYYIGADISVSDQIRLGYNTSIRSAVNAAIITYTGTDDFILAGSGTALNVNSIFGIKVLCPNQTAGKEMLKVADTVAGSTTFNVENCNFTGKKAGSFTDIFSSSIELVGFFVDDGFSVSGNIEVFDFSKVGMIPTDTAFIGLDLGTATFNTLSLSDLVFVNIGTLGDIGIKGLADGANINSGNIGSITSCGFGGVTNALDTITDKDCRLEFLSNSAEVSDTNPDALLHFTGNATNTVIATKSVAVLVAGTWIVNQVSHFTASAAGRATYICERSLAAPVDISVEVEPVSGTNKDITITLIYNDGSDNVAKTKQARSVNANAPAAISIPWQITFGEDDYIELHVQNDTDTVDILVSDATLRVR